MWRLLQRINVISTMIRLTEETRGALDFLLIETAFLCRGSANSCLKKRDIEFLHWLYWNKSDIVHLLHRRRKRKTLMAYSHCTGIGPGQVLGTELGLMGPDILYRNIHTGLRQGKEPVPIVSYCAGPIPSTCPGPVPVQCEQAITVSNGIECH